MAARRSLLLALLAWQVSGLLKPHILFVLVDDLGWADVGFHREQSNPEVVTSNLDGLAASGIQLRRHYVHSVCTPTRTSVQSGRLPVHVNTGLGDVCDDDTGIPYNMTGMAEKMKKAGYQTHFAGKWDAGMSTPRHSPHGRGYDTSLHYFSHKNDFYNQGNMQTCCESDPSIIDFWRTNRGAHDVNGTDYSEFLYQREMVSIIQQHDPSIPLFLFYAPHVAHCPLQVPERYYNKFSWMSDDEDQCRQQTVKSEHPIDPSNLALEYKCRQQHAAMVMLMDEVVGNITGALKARDMWNNTLMIFSSDNGGPVRLAENAANNWPLRGGKYSNFEGGIRATAFVSGGALPPHVRGTSKSGTIHIADWYGTLCSLAGVDAFDDRAAAAGLPPVDSLNVWPYLSGASSHSPRSTVPVDKTCLISGDWKLITAATQPGFWQGPRFPNGSSEELAAPACSDGCLFDVARDPTEQRNLFQLRPDVVASMSSQLAEMRKAFFQNNDKFVHSCPEGVVNCACWLAHNRYGGFLGPYALLDKPVEQAVFQV